MNTSDRDGLLMRYFDGTISPKERTALNTLLLEDADARALLREIVEQAVAMGDLARERAHASPRALSERMRSPVRWRMSLAWAAIAAVVLMAGAAALWFLQGPASEVVTLEQISGAVTLSTDSGPAQNGLQAGATMRAGTLSVEGSTSSAHLRFIDGTSLTLSGDSELALTGETQKRMTLRRGSLNADVRPQKPGQPMRILTSTAEIEVLGTRFQLSTNSGSTTLSVENGHVRMRRLADGSVVDVRQGEMSVATLETVNPLESSRMLIIPTTFRQTFEQAPTALWKGKWLSADNQGPGRLQQVPDVCEKKSDGVPRVNYAVCIHDTSGCVASVGPESILRVRFRAARGKDVLILLSLRHSTGGFAGNFQTIIKPDSSDWRSFEIKLSELKAGFPEHPAIAADSRVSLIYLACFSPKSSLEVSEVAIEPSPSGTQPRGSAKSERKVGDAQ